MTARHPSGGPPPAWILIPIVAASGFAGLGYEMVWTRLFSVSLGTDMMAVLGAVAGLFAGLSLGAFVLDGPIRRARSPRRAYALLEAVIAAWGLISIWLLPAAGRQLPPLLGADPAPGLLWAASFALPALVLLPATTAMGGTLTALERLLTGAYGHARLSAGVYGANTAGAVAGTLVSVYFLFGAFGLSGTLMCLAGVNALCALAALALPWGDDGPPLPRVDAAVRGVGGTRLLITLFLTGLFGILIEVVVIRIAAQTLQNTIYSFAGLLAAYLTGTALGGLLWQRLMPRRSESGGLAGLLALTALAGLGVAFVIPRVASIEGELRVAFLLFLVPSAAMGALFGCLAQAVRDARGSLGWAVGINSLGAALAPVIAAEWLIPGFGAWRTLVGVSLAYLALLPWRRGALLWAALPLACGVMLLVRPLPTLIRVPVEGHLLEVREGPMVTASVVDDAAGVRYLEVNGHFRMGGTSSVRSDYRQALVPLLLHPGPHRALFLGVGTGATLIGGALLPGLSVRGVELSPEVAGLLPLFRDPAGHLPTPPVSIADARRYIAADRDQYDVIIADLFHPALDGSGALYTAEHFAAVRGRLLPGGLFCQWLPLYQLDAPSLRAIVRTFLTVYPGASAWLNHYSVRTPMLVLVGPRDGAGTDGAGVDIVGLDARLRNPDIAAVARPLGLEAPIDMLGQYVGGPHVLATFAGTGPLNTDDRPFVALDASRNVRALTAPPAELLLTLIRAVHPDTTELLSPSQRAGLDARLIAYWRARDRFLEGGAALRGEPRGAALVAAASPALLEAVHLSPEFEPAYQPLLAMARALRGGDPAAAVKLLREIDAAAPSRPEARDLLKGLQGVN